MPSRDVQWIIGTIVAAVIAVSVQMGGIRSDFTEIRTGPTSASRTTACAPSAAK